MAPYSILDKDLGIQIHDFICETIWRVWGDWFWWACLNAEAEETLCFL